MTGIPVHYEREYDMSKGGRVNRQVTLLMVRAGEVCTCRNRKTEEIVSVADHK